MPACVTPPARSEAEEVLLLRKNGVHALTFFVLRDTAMNARRSYFLRIICGKAAVLHPPPFLARCVMRGFRACNPQDTILLKLVV